MAAPGINTVLAGVSYAVVSGSAFTLINLPDEVIKSYTLQNASTGQAYTLLPNSSVQIVFPASGINMLHITVHTVLGSYMAKQAVNVLPSQTSAVASRSAAASAGSSQPEHRLPASSVAFQGYDESAATTSYADYHIYYHYQTGSSSREERILKKPIIILDGFDPQDIRNYKYIYDSLLVYNNYNNKLGEELRQKGYDVVILNFPVTGSTEIEKRKNGDIDIPLINGLRRDGGSDYIERNAFLLVKLVQELNAELKRNSSNEKLVIVGPSMGGLISRYALAYMEKKEAEGVANMNHNTKLWLSFDSPHDGANIPLSIQTGPYFFGYVGGNQQARDSYNKSLRNLAARQMLIEQVNEENRSSSFFTHFFSD